VPRLPITVVIADDHAPFRNGLRRLIKSETNMHVVGEAADGDQALDVVRAVQPDILLLDLVMPRRSGLDVLRELAQSQMPVRTILLTGGMEDAQVIEALRFGALGIVLKDCSTDLLFKSILAVMAGECWVGRERVTDLVGYLRSVSTAEADEGRRKKFALTPRELQIVAAVLAGLTTCEIAQQFSVSEDAVKHRVAKVLDKCGVSNRLELALLRLVDTPGSGSAPVTLGSFRVTRARYAHG
jgi:DNA-binding NarL/FixJ family response regulator